MQKGLLIVKYSFWWSFLTALNFFCLLLIFLIFSLLEQCKKSKIQLISRQKFQNLVQAIFSNVFLQSILFEYLLLLSDSKESYFFFKLSHNNSHHEIFTKEYADCPSFQKFRNTFSVKFLTAGTVRRTSSGE